MKAATKATTPTTTTSPGRPTIPHASDRPGRRPANHATLPTVSEILTLARRAEVAQETGLPGTSDGDKLATALYEVAGRMDRDRPGSFAESPHWKGDCLDNVTDDTPGSEAYGRALARRAEERERRAQVGVVEGRAGRGMFG